MLRKISVMRLSLNSHESASILRRKGSNDSLSISNNICNPTKLKSCNSVKELSRQQSSPTRSIHINVKKGAILKNNTINNTKFNPRKSQSEFTNQQVCEPVNTHFKRSINKINFKSESSLDRKGSNSSELECYKRFTEDKTTKKKSYEDSLVLLKLKDKISVLNGKDNSKKFSVGVENFDESIKRFISSKCISPVYSKSPILDKNFLGLGKEYYERTKKPSISKLLKFNEDKQDHENVSNSDLKTKIFTRKKSDSNLITNKKASQIKNNIDRNPKSNRYHLHQNLKPSIKLVNGKNFVNDVIKDSTKNDKNQNFDEKILSQNVISYYDMPKDYDLLKKDEYLQKKSSIDNDQATINNYKNEIKFLRAKNKEMQDIIGKPDNQKEKNCQKCTNNENNNNKIKEKLGNFPNKNPEFLKNKKNCTINPTEAESICNIFCDTNVFNKTKNTPMKKPNFNQESKKPNNRLNSPEILQNAAPQNNSLHDTSTIINHILKSWRTCFPVFIETIKSVLEKKDDAESHLKTFLQMWCQNFNFLKQKNYFKNTVNKSNVNELDTENFYRKMDFTNKDKKVRIDDDESGIFSSLQLDSNTEKTKLTEQNNCNFEKKYPEKNNGANSNLIFQTPINRIDQMKCSNYRDFLSDKSTGETNARNLEEKQGIYASNTLADILSTKQCNIQNSYDLNGPYEMEFKFPYNESELINQYNRKVLKRLRKSRDDTFVYSQNNTSAKSDERPVFESFKYSIDHSPLKIEPKNDIINTNTKNDQYSVNQKSLFSNFDENFKTDNYIIKTPNSDQNYNQNEYLQEIKNDTIVENLKESQFVMDNIQEIFENSVQDFLKTIKENTLQNRIFNN